MQTMHSIRIWCNQRKIVRWPLIKISITFKMLIINKIWPVIQRQTVIRPNWSSTPRQQLTFHRWAFTRPIPPQIRCTVCIITANVIWMLHIWALNHRPASLAILHHRIPLKMFDRQALCHIRKWINSLIVRFSSSKRIRHICTWPFNIINSSNSNNRMPDAAINLDQTIWLPSITINKNRWFFFCKNSSILFVVSSLLMGSAFFHWHILVFIFVHVLNQFNRFIILTFHFRPKSTII